MATIGDIFGFSVEFDLSNALFRGFSVLQRENLKLIFKDKSGVDILDLEKLTLFNGVTTTTYNNLTGGFYEFYNPTSATLTITITHEGDVFSKSFLHSGEGFWVEEILQIPSPPELGKIKNSFNFIRWHEAINVFIEAGKLGSKDELEVFTPINQPVSNYVDCSNDLDLPNNYERDSIKQYQPPFIFGDDISVIMNFNPILLDEATYSITIDHENVTSASQFTVGTNVTGSTSGATGLVSANLPDVSGITASIRVTNITGDFIIGENLSGFAFGGGVIPYNRVIENLKDKSLSGAKMAIVNKNGDIIEDNFNIDLTVCTDIHNYMYSLVFPDIKPDNNYRFLLYDVDSLRVYYVSNPFRVEEQINKLKFPYLEYRNSCDMFSYGYKCLLGSYTKLRLDLNMIENQPEIELKQYREQSTGKIRNQKTQTARNIKLESFMFDKGAHDAMLALSVHDEITLNGKVLEVKSAYKIVTNKLNPRQKGEIEFYDQDYSTINLHGS